MMIGLDPSCERHPQSQEHDSHEEKGNSEGPPHQPFIHFFHSGCHDRIGMSTLRTPSGIMADLVMTNRTGISVLGNREWID